MQKTGLLIVFEGIDGTGKKTECALLGKYLASRRFQVSHFSYPDYASDYGRRIKAYLHTGKKMSGQELFLNYLVDMVKDKEKVNQDLKKGKIVLIDRYYFSTIAYQIAGSFKYEEAKLIEEVAGLPKPDLVLFFDLPVSVAMSRKRKQMQGRVDKHEKDYNLLQNTTFYYKKMINEKFRAKKWVVLDARESVEKVNKKVISAANSLLTGAGRL